MHTLINLLAGAPQSVSVSFGPWVHFIWVVIIIALVIMVCWWGWGRIAPSIPEPIRTILFVLGIILLCAVVILYILLPLMSVF